MIIVCSLSDHKHVCENVKANHLISVIDPGYEPKTPANVKYHLKLGFDDIIEINENNIIHRENETLSNFYRGLDPTNSFNAGIGKMSKRKLYE